MVVINPNEVQLNSVRYKLKGEIQPVLVSNFPDKTVIGDYSADNNPLASSWVTYDLLGGVGSTSYEVGSERHCWWTNCICEYEGNITSPRLATEITTFNGKTVTPTWTQGTDEAGTGWANPGEASDGTYNSGGAYTGALGTGNWSNYLSMNMPLAFYGKARYSIIAGYADGDMQIDVFDGYAWTNIFNAAPTMDGAYHEIDITDQVVVQVRMRRKGGSLSASHGSFITEVQLETASIAAPAGTMGPAANFNGELYWAIGTHLLKLDSGRASFTTVAMFGTNITALIPSLNSKLYIFLGDSYNYCHMTTAEVFTQSNSASAYWGFQWDGKLFKVNTSGASAYSTDPDGASPTWDASATITENVSEVESFLLGDDYIYGTVPYCATNSILKFLDFDNAVWLDTALRLPNHPNGGVGACHWRDGLYISSGLDVLKFQSSQVPIIQNISILKAGGIPLEYNGEIVKLNGDGVNEMFALVDASQTSGTSKSGLYAWDEFGWKCWWVDSGDNGDMHDIVVSSAESAYAVYWDCGGSIFYIDLPRGIRNPTYLSTATFATSGSLYTSWFNGGWLVGNKRANRLRVGTKGMSANETLVVKYRLDKTYTDLSTGWTTLGTIVSGTETVYTFGSGAGITFKDIQFRVDYARGSTSTNTPALRYMALEYNRIIPKVWGWQMVLDCSAAYHDVPSETLLDNLVTAAETETLVPMLYGRNQTTANYVEVVSVQGSRLTGDLPKGHYFVIVREVM